MKFQILEKIYPRFDVKQYFRDYTNLNNYNLYHGVVNDYFSLLIINSDNYDIIDIDCNNIISVKYSNKNYNNNDIEMLLDKIENNTEKSIDIYFNDLSFLKFPISIDFMDWIKAEYKIFTETSNDYKTISLPYIKSILDKNTKWIHDLIHNYSEESKILFRNNDFVISKDIIWKNNNKNEFYILAFPVKRIKNIREIKLDDIELLNNIKEKCIEISKLYSINENQLYMYFHYHPSYYHLHLHVCTIEHFALENKYMRHYFLDDVIDEIKKNDSYWINKTLKFELLSNTKLYKLLNELKN